MNDESTHPDDAVHSTMMTTREWRSLVATLRIGRDMAEGTDDHAMFNFWMEELQAIYDPRPYETDEDS